MALRIGEYWRSFWREPLSFRLACAYIFFEYYRPQSIYPVLAIVPWSMLCLVGGLFALASEGGLRSRARSVVSVLILVFAGVVLVSSFQAWDPSLSWARWESFWLWLPVYLLIIGSVTTFRRFVLFLALWALWSAKMALSGMYQWASVGFQFLSWGVYGSPGWFQNSGEMGIQMVIFFSILLMATSAVWRNVSAFKRFVMGGLLLAAALCVVATASRGAMGGLAVSIFWMVLFTRYKLRALLGVGVLGTLLVFATPPEFKERFTTIGTDATSVQRVKYRTRGLDIIRENPVLGIGYGNWLGYYRNRYQEQGHEPHNIYIQAGVELGYTGLIAFLLLALSGFLVNRRTRIAANRLVSSGVEHARFLRNIAIGLDAGQIGFLGTGYFVTVLYYPFFWIGLALTVALNHVAVQETMIVAAASGQGRSTPPDTRMVGRARSPLLGRSAGRFRRG